MKDEEIKGLARQFAEDTNPAEYYGMDFAYREESVENAAELAEEAIRWLLRDHCIVSKEKLIETRRSMCKVLERNKNGVTLEDHGSPLDRLFGEELFRGKIY